MLKWDWISTLVYTEKLKIGTSGEKNSEESFNSTDMDYKEGDLQGRMCLSLLGAKLEKFLFWGPQPSLSPLHPLPVLSIFPHYQNLFLKERVW